MNISFIRRLAGRCSDSWHALSLLEIYSALNVLEWHSEQLVDMAKCCPVIPKQTAPSARSQADGDGKHLNLAPGE